MSEFWQYFATGMMGFIAGLILGRAMGITQMLLRQQQAMTQGMPGMMPPGMNMSGSARPPGMPNGPA